MVEKKKPVWENENWAAWEKRYGWGRPEFTPDENRIEVLASRLGLPTVRVMSPNGRPVFLHSSVDPVKESQRIAEGLSIDLGTVIIVKGFGLGYLVEALLAEVDEKIPIFVLEPDRELFYTAMQVRDLRPIIDSGRVFILPGDSRDEVYNMFFLFFEDDRYKRIVNTGLPGHQTIYGDFFVKADETIWDVVNAKLLNLVTMIKLGPDMLSSAILNLVDYYIHPGIQTLFDRFANKPAIIVSAGPSLNKNINLLHEAKGKAIIMAVGTAVKALQKQGIQPDFIVTIDPHPLNYEHFKEVDTTKAVLITEVQANHMILANYKGPMFISGGTPVLQWFGDLFEDKGMMESGGSVANSALSMAYKMGANPIVLVGQDLAYAIDGHSHAAGTNYEDIKITNKEEGLGYFAVKANDGGKLMTDRAFYQFLCYFELWMRNNPDREYINATEGGAFIEGTKVMTLREVLDQYCKNPVDTEKIIRQAQDSFKVPSLKLLLESLKNQIVIIDNAIIEAKKAIKQLHQLEKACEKKQAKKMRQHLNAVGKIYQKFSEDEFIANLPQWFSKRDLHGVLYRTHSAEFAEDDDFHAAIADYNIYYEKVREGAEKVGDLLKACIEEGERRV